MGWTSLFKRSPSESMPNFEYRISNGLWMTLVLASLALSVGCQPTRIAEAPKPLKAVTQGDESLDPRDAPSAVPVVFQVEMFVISMPRGTYSGNEEFWKRIDEDCVDPATSDLLYKNGIRIGIARLAELEHFGKFITDALPPQKFALSGTEVKDIEIDMKLRLPEQTLFHFDRNGTLTGRSYDGSDNILNVSFQPALRKPGQLRLTLAPMIRAMRKRLQYTALNGELEVQGFINPEVLYDLNCRVDIPQDSFLILTPSPEASRPTSIGNAFFMKDGPSERLEQVVLVVAKAIKIDQPRAK
jgi:hypothetical protein